MPTATLPDLDCAVPAPHCKAPIKGNGLGTNYITPLFAGKSAVAQQCHQSGNRQRGHRVERAVGGHCLDLQRIASGNPSNQYFQLAASINPGKCCYLGYLYGITSFDGLHPSNTGYALIAYDFIKTINQAYGTHIPQIDLDGSL